MSRRGRAAAIAPLLSVAFPVAAVGIAPAYGDLPRSPKPASHAAPAPRRLIATIDDVSPRMRRDHDLTVSGRLTNPSRVDWLDAQVYLEISPEPARTLRGLNDFAAVPQSQGFGNGVYSSGLFDEAGDVPAGKSRPFEVTVPYSDLPISGKPGVYRVGVKVVAGTSAGRDPALASHASTVVPLLPRKPSNLHPVQTLTLLPITAPVKRLLNGAFTDDSLAAAISFGGRLYNVLAWALKAPPETLQVVVDPALLTALDNMSHGYRVRPPGPAAESLPGTAQDAAVTWMLNFGRLSSQQHVMVLPWGVPAANSLLANQIPGPVVSAVRASETYIDNNPFGTAVAGWLTDGGSGLPAISAINRAGAGLQIVAQSSLPALSSGHQVTRGLPSVVMVKAGARRVPVLVTATKLAGYQTTSTTSAVQFRQRLIADAAVRSISGDLSQVRVTALPFRWNPGTRGSEEGLDSAFALPIVVPQSAIGAADRPAPLYTGPIRPGPDSVDLAPVVLTAIRSFHESGAPLAAILRPARPAISSYEHSLAMAGSYEWRAFPLLGQALIHRQTGLAARQLAKVTVTGPPFVAMSSTTGRFPLTVTNGLDQDISLHLAVMPEDPALNISPLGDIAVPAGERRDIQIVSTAEGSGVTSVRARLATPEDVPFGRPWRFDVRATQIGLVIWVVMGVGGVILFGAAGFRIVNRVRGKEQPRRQSVT
jgi:hypothetical protein